MLSAVSVRLRGLLPTAAVAAVDTATYWGAWAVAALAIMPVYLWAAGPGAPGADTTDGVGGFGWVSLLVPTNTSDLLAAAIYGLVLYTALLTLHRRGHTLPGIGTPATPRQAAARAGLYTLLTAVPVLWVVNVAGLVFPARRTVVDLLAR